MASLEEDALQTIAQENERILVSQLLALISGNSGPRIAVPWYRIALVIALNLEAIVLRCVRRATVLPSVVTAVAQCFAVERCL